MCGIVGIVTRLAQRTAVQAALDCLAARGPDGAGLVQAGGLWLGVRRLAITDPTAPQPLRAAHGEAWIAFNGSVTDPATERAQLAVAAVPLRTGNDAELALQRACSAGAAGVVALRGMFALAVVDVAANRLLLARDRFGEKPLWLAWQDQRVVAFASTVAALRMLLPVPALPRAAVPEFLRSGFCAGPLAAGSITVAPLQPGHAVSQSLSGTEPARTVAAPPVPSPVPSPAVDPAASLRAALCASVRLKASAEVPVGLFLSGGLDSSALAAACALEQRRVHAWTLHCSGTPAGEVTRATAVANGLGLPHTVVHAGPEVLDALPALTSALGLPIGDPSLLLVFRLAQAAAAAGCRVVLAGEGADELLLGYRRYALVPWIWRLRALLPAPLRRWLATTAGAARTALARVRRALASDDPYATLLEIAAPALLEGLLADGPEPRGAAPVAAVRTPAAAAAQDLGAYLPLDLLVKLDHGLMAAGVEGRCPYLDPAVVAATAALPARGVRTSRKSWLAAAFAGELPAAVRRARKQGFALPLDQWLRRHALVRDVLSSSAARQRGWFVPAAMDRLLLRLERGAPGLGLPLFVACALELHLGSVDKGQHA